MTMKCTAGPWYVAYSDENGQSVVSGEHTEVATCWHHCVGSIEQEMHANASLIAAAPDLLAAAKRSLQGWDNAIELAIILPQHRNTSTILADELRAAIAKATGKQEG